MGKHTVNSYENELNRLRYSVINMANLVKDLIRIGNDAIKNPSKSFVQLANDTDKKINHYDREIENLAINVLALRHPMAVDLRHVIASFKLAVIFERMGDLAKKVSHRIEYIPISLSSELDRLIQAMIAKLDKSLNDVILAYETLDDALASKVSTQDEAIDNYYIKIMDVLEKQMEMNPKDAKPLLDLVLIARNFERIGDYITKVSYLTHYIITGNKIIDD
ncbi:MAG: phosphate signaling complex protein PhoU [Rickettsiales bacterium]|nr:phosphate signaling complex protein PhoU [Rickettsiales bacterium]